MLWFGLWLCAGATEIPYDGIDQDGDGYDLVDQDRDGAASELAGGSDCNDRDASVHPLAFDREADGVDQDCDGKDGFAEGWIWGGLRWSAANLSALWCGRTIEKPHGGPYGERHPHQPRQEVGAGAGRDHSL